MMELLQWLEPLSVKNLVTEQSVSNLLLILYVISYVLNRKGGFIVAFIFCEIFGNSFISDYFSDLGYYLFYAMAYSFLYYYCYINKMRVITLFACVTIILLDIGMAIDAEIYNGVKGFLWSNYIYFAISLHLLLICTLFRWKRIGRILVSHTRATYDNLHINDVIAFYCYNATKAPNRKTQCQTITQQMSY